MLTRKLSRNDLVLGLALLMLALVVGLASSMLSAHASEPTPQLPNLVADPPTGVYTEVSTTEGGLKSTAEPQLLLRFNGYIHNLGPGALDFRGSRTSSSEPMNAFQRVYNSDGSFKEEPSPAELVYATADGHEHWHLQRAAKYSLWNLAKSAEVAPAMKVGFCLDDSEHVETAVGPEEAVYSDATGREFCRQHQPEATSLFEGVSPGWRDLYRYNLAYQWVDASNVLPGEYFLREDVNTTGVIKETGSANVPAYTTSPVVIPGFDALPQSLSTTAGTPQTITLTAQAFKDSVTPTYKIVTGPSHGTLSPVNQNQVTYTPTAGYTGQDTFTFSAADPSSPFPRTPAVASITLSVNSGFKETPTIVIATAPASLTAGTSGPLSVSVTHDTGGVEWSTTAGSVTGEGAEGLAATLTAPSLVPGTGAVTVTARLRDRPEITDQASIAVTAALVPEAQPISPVGPVPPSPGSGVHGEKTVKPALARPTVALIGRRLVMSTLATISGRIRLSAYLGHRRLGTCVTVTPPERNFTCRLTLTHTISLRAHIRVLASVRAGSLLLRSARPAAPVTQLKMAGHTLHSIAASASWEFWCEPSALPAARVQRAAAFAGQ